MVKPGRLRIMREWIGRDVWVNFPVRGMWYLVEQDELVRAVAETAPYLESMSWKARGAYSTGGPSRRVTGGWRGGDTWSWRYKRRRVHVPRTASGVRPLPAIARSKITPCFV